ncbi:MAG: MBL fold metallo-hydrolase [candidate division WOR-3 bacterium]
MPSAGRDTVKYGGNTACVEIRLASGEIIVIDAGTGIRKLGAALLQEFAQKKTSDPIVIHMLFTHFHWDHIQGFPFFRPIFDNRFNFKIYGHPGKNFTLKEILAAQIRAPYLPFLFEDLRARIEIFELGEESFSIGETQIHSIPTNHPNNNYAYKIIEDKKTLVFMSDNNLSPPEHQLITIFDTFVRFCANANLLIHDTQWSDEEAKLFSTWGHSSYSQVLDLAVKARVKSVVFFHHDPYHSDRDIDNLVKKAKLQVKNSRPKIKCQAAKEGLLIKI